MLSKVKSALIATVLASTTAWANADLSSAVANAVDKAQPYAGIKIGHSGFHNDVNQFETEQTSKNRNSANYGLILGVEPHKNLAVEATVERLGHLKVKADNQEIGKHSARAVTLAVKPKYEVYENTNVYGKVGIASVRSDFKTSTLSEHQTKTSAVLGAGIEYQITDNLRAGIDYQFVDKVAKYPGYRPDVHSFGANLTYHFGAPKTAKYVLEENVLFEFDRSAISEPGKTRLAEIADQHKNAGHWIVTGHTDRIGKADYNQALSEKRAVAVTEELQERVSGEIFTQGVGSIEPVTGAECDNLKGDELKACLGPDRRVEIKVGK